MSSPGFEDEVATSDTVRMERAARPTPAPTPIIEADDPTVIMPACRAQASDVPVDSA